MRLFNTVAEIKINPPLLEYACLGSDTFLWEFCVHDPFQEASGGLRRLFACNLLLHSPVQICPLLHKHNRLLLFLELSLAFLKVAGFCELLLLVFPANFSGF